MVTKKKYSFTILRNGGLQGSIMPFSRISKKRKEILKIPLLYSLFLKRRKEIVEKILKNQGLAPVLVIFFEGLIGPGGLV
jgi:hypothetical protein